LARFRKDLTPLKVKLRAKIVVELMDILLSKAGEQWGS
jgi:hypothetical protein